MDVLRSQVIHETLDGEAVIIDLESGTYYSLEGVGAVIWDRLIAGEPARDTAEELARQNGESADVVLAAVLGLHHQLHAAGLISDPPEPVPAADGSSGMFVVPHLQRYEDLQEHLLVDPIHDVERGAGWPVVAKPS